MAVLEIMKITALSTIILITFLLLQLYIVLLMKIRITIMIIEIK